MVRNYPFNTKPTPKPGSPNRSWVRIIGVVNGSLLRSYGFVEIREGKMSERQSRSYAKVALGDLIEDPFGGKEGRKDVKTGSMSKAKSNLVLEKGRFKHTRHYQAPRGMSVLTRGMRNLNACIGW